MAYEREGRRNVGRERTVGGRRWRMGSVGLERRVNVRLVSGVLRRRHCAQIDERDARAAADRNEYISSISRSEACDVEFPRALEY